MANILSVPRENLSQVAIPQGEADTPYDPRRDIPMTGNMIAQNEQPMNPYPTQVASPQNMLSGEQPATPFGEFNRKTDLAEADLDKLMKDKAMFTMIGLDDFAKSIDIDIANAMRKSPEGSMSRWNAEAAAAAKTHGHEFAKQYLQAKYAQFFPGLENYVTGDRDYKISMGETPDGSGQFYRIDPESGTVEPIGPKQGLSDQAKADLRLSQSLTLKSARRGGGKGTPAIKTQVVEVMENGIPVKKQMITNKATGEFTLVGLSVGHGKGRNAFDIEDDKVNASIRGLSEILAKTGTSDKTLVKAMAEAKNRKYGIAVDRVAAEDDPDPNGRPGQALNNAIKLRFGGFGKSPQEMKERSKIIKNEARARRTAIGAK